MRLLPLLVVFTVMLLGWSFALPVHAQQYFSDVSSSDPDCDAINDMAVNQLMEGFPDGTFKPEIAMRQVDGIMVMARLLNVALKGYMVIPAFTPKATIVLTLPSKHWAYSAADFLAKYGLLSADTEQVNLKVTPFTRRETLTLLSRLMHSRDVTPIAAFMQELQEDCLLPDGWLHNLEQPVTRREMAALLDKTLCYLMQHAMTEGTITAFDNDENGDRWVHLSTTLGEARLRFPVRGMVVKGGADDSLHEGMRIRTVSDVVNGAQGKPYYRVREVQILS